MAEEKKARGEPTGPLPVPSVAPKRRYEATPSAIVPRPLAPLGELMPEAEDGRFPPKGKPIAMSPQPMPLHGRIMPENERTANRYAPLAQASTGAAAPSVAATLGDDGSRAMRTQAPSSRIPGPRLGFFTDDRRDSAILPATSQRAQEMQMPSRHTAAAGMPQELSRMDPLSSQAYIPGQPPPSLIPPSHSRHPSLTQAPGSPSQLSRPELDISSVHRDPFAQRAYYSLQGQPGGLSHSPRPGLSPVKDTLRPSATPVPESTSRQVPAKRSNIMSILNDEPEEPQPRKRFASEVPPGPGSGAVSASRSVYQPGDPARLEEPGMPGSGQKPSSYSQPSPYQTPSRGYPEYGNYGPPQVGSGTAANNDWMARFDPRAQQAGPPTQAQPPPSSQSGRPVSSLSAQGSYGHYASAQSQHVGPLNAMPVPSPAPTPPPAASQRSAYPSVFSQPGVPSGAREMVSQPSAYRPASPPPRASSAAYGSRPEPPTPSQSSTSLFGMASRQPGSQLSYSPAAPSTPAAQQHSQSYHQHVQTMVNGSHQPHRSNAVGLAGGPSQYGQNTPPPQAQGRSMPSLASLGRSYTPPSAMHHGGMGYAQPPPSASGGIPSLHQRPPGPGEPGIHTSGHHRVYSQGSVQGGIPGPLHPPSQPPR